MFVTLFNRVFVGIDAHVRKSLEFKYNQETITELQQINFIVANDGDRAIRDCIEPLTIAVNKPVRLLDASILYRSPADLRVELTHSSDEKGAPVITCSFPVMNAGEFFLVKLLLDCYVKQDDLFCQILCDDLPRKFATKLLSSSAMREPTRRIEWGGIGVGSFFLAMIAVFGLVIWNYYRVRPAICPYPWATFQPTWIETPALVLCLAVMLLTFILGVMLIVGIGFESFLDRTPRFPIPLEHRTHGYGVSRRQKARSCKWTTAWTLPRASANDTCNLEQPQRCLALLVEFADRGCELDHANWLNAGLVK